LASNAFGLAGCAAAEPGKSPYSQWTNGPSSDPDFFPIAVWLQSAGKAPEYKAIGINTYIGQWQGPTEEQLAELKRHGMKVICSQNEVGLKHLDDPTIIGWMHGDEPDNFKRVEDKWVPVAKPPEIIADYQRMRRSDPTRPVYLNLGQGVSNDVYKGSWAKPEDYFAFAGGADILSYDIYPMKSTRPENKDKMWLVPLGVRRLHKYGGGRKVVWNIIECTPDSEGEPTPQHLKAEVWMSLVHGSQGICYFCHQFRPTFIEAGLLHYKEMAKAAGEANKQVLSLAPVLNSPTVEDAVQVECRPATASPEMAEKLGAGPVAAMVKRYKRATYLFAVRMENGPVRARFTVKGVKGASVAEVIDEDRRISVRNGSFTDDFKPYEVHLYKIVPTR
jgi:hypothetical protein